MGLKGAGALPSSRLFTNRNAGFFKAIDRSANHPHRISRGFVRLVDKLVRLERLNRHLACPPPAQQGTDRRDARREDALAVGLGREKDVILTDQQAASLNDKKTPEVKLVAIGGRLTKAPPRAPTSRSETGNPQFGLECSDRLPNPAQSLLPSTDTFATPLAARSPSPMTIRLPWVTGRSTGRTRTAPPEIASAAKSISFLPATQ